MEQRISTPAHLGHILKARRRRYKLTQTDLAERLGIGQKRLSQLEATPEMLTLERLLALANFLDLEITVRDRSAGTSTSPAGTSTDKEW